MRALKYSTDATAWAADYEAFGRAWTYVPGSSSPPDFEINLRLPGQYFDEETGLHYNWHRYYSPDLGRYLQPDPITVAVPGWSQPTYAYAFNSPFVFRDPTGLDAASVARCYSECVMATLFGSEDFDDEYEPS
jgi:RHS repeat-associated protein